MEPGQIDINLKTSINLACEEVCFEVPWGPIVGGVGWGWWVDGWGGVVGGFDKLEWQRV